MKVAKWIVVFSSVAFIIFFLFYPRPTRITCFYPRHIAISEITYGPFVESVAVTGVMNDDSMVDVLMDSIYLNKIQVDVKAYSEIRSREYALKVNRIDTTLKGGLLNVTFSFEDSIPIISKDVRVRILLSDSVNVIRLPIGGSYKDTHGEWILVVKNDEVTKRPIKLGRRAPDYLEVLAGLNPGETVITSSYENYISRFDLSKTNDLKELTALDN